MDSFFSLLHFHYISIFIKYNEVIIWNLRKRIEKKEIYLKNQN